MELTPLDIKNQEFNKKTFGGLDPEEVRAFLRQVANVFEQMTRSRNENRERVKVLEERIHYYKQIEKTLQDTAVTMQKTMDESKVQANKTAELIVAEAHAAADRETERIRRDADTLRVEISSLQNQKKNYFIRIRSLIQAQEQLLNAMEEDDRLESSPPAATPPKESPADDPSAPLFA